MPVTINGSSGIDAVQPGVIVQADLAANVAGNGPCFSAYQSSAQASSVTFAKVNFQTEQFDTANAFDSVTNYRFQPTVAGYYQCSGSVAAGSTAASINIAFYLNGSVEKAGVVASGASMFSAIASALIYLNGSTDYVELWASSSVAQNWQNTKQGTFFQGFLARAA